MSGFSSARLNRERLRRPRMAYKGSEIKGGDGRCWAQNICANDFYRVFYLAAVAAAFSAYFFWC